MKAVCILLTCVAISVFAQAQDKSNGQKLQRTIIDFSRTPGILGQFIAIEGQWYFEIGDENYLERVKVDSSVINYESASRGLKYWVTGNYRAGKNLEITNMNPEVCLILEFVASQQPESEFPQNLYTNQEVQNYLRTHQIELAEAQESCDNVRIVETLGLEIVN